jgi:UDP-N-acetylmuramate--alanine ligase
VHFVGVAGSGMAGIAYVAHKSGIRVSGSDLHVSSYVEPLLAAGAEVVIGHSAANLTDGDIELVVASSAVPSTNPELICAHERGIEVWPRARMLAYLGQDHEVLAVSGTHGKTTTSAMLATALIELGADPSFLIGGVVNSLNTSAHLATGAYIVMEADESDASFTWLNPNVAIVTNIEADHMDHFESLEEIEHSFLAFLDKLDPAGIAIVCADSPGLKELAQQSDKPFITYGSRIDADVRLVLEPRPQVVFADGSRFDLTVPASPGIHNLLNATAVMAALDWLGFDRQESVQSLRNFSGVHRRFDCIGAAAGVQVIDDYGHHPTEVSATLAAARQQSFEQVHLLFQPHRYTRTQAFIHEFARAFDDADTITLMEIYTAGETAITGIDSNRLLRAIKEHKPTTRVRLISQRHDVAQAMAELAQPGSVIITMGAGDVTYLAPEILDELQLKEGRSEPV